MHSGHPVSVRFPLTLATVVVALNVLVGAVFAFGLKESEKRVETDVVHATENVALLIDKNLSVSFGKIDVALQAVVDQLQMQLRLGGGLDATKINAMLTERGSWIPDFAEYRVTDASGWVKYGSNVDPSDPITFADRDYFLAHGGNNDSGLIVTNPVLDRVLKRWVVAFTRRYNLPDGRFGGGRQCCRPHRIFRTRAGWGRSGSPWNRAAPVSGFGVGHAISPTG